MAVHSLYPAVHDDSLFGLDVLLRSFAVLTCVVALAMIWSIANYSNERVARSSSATAATAELPPELVWKRQSENFDDMFRRIY